MNRRRLAKLALAVAAASAILMLSAQPSYADGKVTVRLGAVTIGGDGPHHAGGSCSICVGGRHGGDKAVVLVCPHRQRPGALLVRPVPHRRPRVIFVRPLPARPVVVTARPVFRWPAICGVIEFGLRW